ncbi:MAG: glycosyltransferase family 4 protein [Rhodospirillum sp.]|nr:glycosyltransferase family 4 protein [Rhodospirillum sp.]MCF8488761.1 glycosyltransferase family 4 protein [Rhodospirillum sp.]MCF8499713.1 glycosyltransferase family 4 protein [Rhodospirillum sp.]
MTIAFYAPQKAPDDPVPSGDRLLSRLLMEILDRAEYPVELASRFRSLDRAGDTQRQERLAGLGARETQRVLRRLCARPVETRPKLWFTCAPSHRAPDWVGPVVADALDIPYLVAQTGYDPFQDGGPWTLGARRMADGLRRADRILQLNGGEVDPVAKAAGNRSKIQILEPFLDTSPFAMVDADAVRAAMTEAHGLDSGRPWLLTVAMMRPGHKETSYRLLARALRHVPGRSFQLIVAGDGPARPAVEEALAPLSPLFLGELDAALLTPLYAACDLMVWPALNESFGMALLEAQAAGLPVVAGRSGAATVIHDEKTGLITPARDYDAMAEAVAFLLLNPGLRHAMGREAAWRAQRHNSLETATWRVQQAIETIAA